jgi:hypothetical protein
MSTPFKWQKTGLSAVQIKLLCMMAKQAFLAAQQRGDPRTEDGAEDYRKAGQKEAAQIDSLKVAHQGHFLALRGYWFTILGNLEQAFYDFLNAGETSEAMRQMKWRLMGQVAVLAEGIRTEKGRVQIVIDEAQAAAEAWAYAQHLARDKFHGRRIDSLSAKELEELGFTVNNRANAKLGKGKAADRNKKQASKGTPKTVSEEPFKSDSRISTKDWIGAEAERTHTHENPTV